MTKNKTIVIKSERAFTIFKKMVENKKVIQKAIQEGKPLNKLEGIKLVSPI
ncbi:MAG: hypothetical protein O9340_12045 [Cyclobacteriaceae bacterium]|nr:hypothetical protein [Cyclobacteriaceae bacterium]